MDVNIRSADMWAILTREAGFKGLSIIDFGSGYGDMMLFALRDGATHVLGVDRDMSSLNTASTKCKSFDGASFYHADFEDESVFENAIQIGGIEDEERLDVAFCFSVLPYLKDPASFVNKMQKHFETVYIECQYIGDGPGNIANNDDEMASWLFDQGFLSVYALGKTHVDGRDKYRTIWECW
jgi:SAM-dependent methyltransferase